MLRALLSARPQFLTASLFPVLVAGAYVKWYSGSVDAGLWILTLAGVALLHLGANLFNDYFDHLSGADEINTAFVSPFTGGSRAIQQGIVSASQVLFAALLTTALGSAVGIYLAAARGSLIILLGAIGVFTYFFYTAPPISFSHRGLGELVVALDFGLLPMLGTEYVLTQHTTAQMALLSLPVACFVANILLINEFPDAEADALVGKRHLVVQLGRRQAVTVVFGLYCIALSAVALAVVLAWLPVAVLWSFLAAIPAAVACLVLGDAPDDPSAWAIACPAGVIAHAVFCALLFISLLAASPPLVL